jgi:hypothetical protein
VLASASACRRPYAGARGNVGPATPVGFIPVHVLEAHCPSYVLCSPWRGLRIVWLLLPPSVPVAHPASFVYFICSCAVGDSLEDLEAMRLSSASFAAALAEAEAIAANVEASIARRQQKQQDAAANAAAAAAAAQEGGAATDRWARQDPYHSKSAPIISC